MIISLKNNDQTAEISTRGAELMSLYRNGREYLWNGDPSWWASRAPLLFPICGSVKDDSYTHAGQKYDLPKHGFARFKEFSVEYSDDSSAVFLLKSDDETKAAYPFDFELRLIYRLNETGIEITYSVRNTSSVPMYYSIGAHEGYACPGGIENYDVIFAETETLDATVLSGPLLSDSRHRILTNERVLPLKDEYFVTDALVFEQLKSGAVELKDRRDGTSVKVDFEGFQHLLLWTKPGAPYICIEPWCGLPDSTDADGDISVKRSIIELLPGMTKEHVHSIII